MTEPREIGRTFAGDVVRAIMAGRQTQDRRPIRPQPVYIEYDSPCSPSLIWDKSKKRMWETKPEDVNKPPFGSNMLFGNRINEMAQCRPGDLVYVRETIWISDCEKYYARKNIRDYYEVFTEDMYWPWPDGVCKYAPPKSTGFFKSKVKGFKLGFSDNDTKIIIDPGTGNTQIKNYSAVFRKRIPSIHMPKWAARLWLRVTDVRVERVQEISHEDAVAEGCENREAFRALWNRLYAKPRPVKDGGKIVGYQCWPWVLMDFVNQRGEGGIREVVERFERGERQFTEWNGLPLHVYDNPYVEVIEFKQEVRT